jgi:CRP/FNR family cyclic AMP-dependent transcriptional regulator
VDIDFEALKQITYFIGLTPEELDSIKHFLTRKTVEKGEIFVLEGDWSDSLYFVISGVVKVYKTSADGKQQILNIAGPGESLNDVTTFDDWSNAADMVAMTPVILYVIKKHDLKNFVLKYPRIAVNALRILAGRVRRDSVLVETLSFNQVIGRLAKVLLKYNSEKPIPGLKLTQQDMADMVGTSREMVNKSLKVMEINDAIRLQRTGIVVTNKKTLEEMSRIHLPNVKSKQE